MKAAKRFHRSFESRKTFIRYTRNWQGVPMSEAPWGMLHTAFPEKTPAAHYLIRRALQTYRQRGFGAAVVPQGELTRKLFVPLADASRDGNHCVVIRSWPQSNGELHISAYLSDQFRLRVPMLQAATLACVHMIGALGRNPLPVKINGEVCWTRGDIFKRIVDEVQRLAEETQA